MNTAKEILDQLDQCAEQYVFPMLDNGYIYPGDVRLTIYRDNVDWLMILEHFGANPRTLGYASFQNCLYVFGSKLPRQPGTANESFLEPMASAPGDWIFDAEFGWNVVDGAHSVLLRGQLVEFDLSSTALERKGIELYDGQRDAVAVMRSLLPEHRDLILASDAELAARNPHGLPLWLRLDEWHHPDLAKEELPSQSETFQMLAAAIATGDKSKYCPTKSPNTHWKNWPEGGTL
ncbi:MAG: hypothetical protein QM813_01325 [Verrucomicrobiota bacterium]